MGADELSLDVYGDGGTVGILEEEVRTLLDKPAAAFMPSGTMIQQIALRIHADRRNRRVVAFHPTCHLELHEDKAYQRMHGLVGIPVGDRHNLITLADLEGIQEPLAALLIELPQREIGGQLPAWKDLVAQIDWAHKQGAAVHMDGARLWECGPFYGRPPSEIAALFDTVYVSFYKGLGGVAGGMLLGEEDVIAEAREWRHRHGGTLFGLWPYAAAALAGLRLRLPRMDAYVAHARAVAAALSAIDGVRGDPRSAADADDAHRPADYGVGGQCRRPKAREGAEAVGFRRIGAERHSGLQNGGVVRRRRHARADPRRGGRCGPGAPGRLAFSLQFGKRQCHGFLVQSGDGRLPIAHRRRFGPES